MCLIICKYENGGKVIKLKRNLPVNQTYLFIIERDKGFMKFIRTFSS